MTSLIALPPETLLMLLESLPEARDLRNFIKAFPPADQLFRRHALTVLRNVARNISLSRSGIVWDVLRACQSDGRLKGSLQDNKLILTVPRTSDIEHLLLRDDSTQTEAQSILQVLIQLTSEVQEIAAWLVKPGNAPRCIGHGLTRVIEAVWMLLRHAEMVDATAESRRVDRKDNGEQGYHLENEALYQKCITRHCVATLTYAEAVVLSDVQIELAEARARLVRHRLNASRKAILEGVCRPHIAIDLRLQLQGRLEELHHVQQRLHGYFWRLPNAAFQPDTTREDERDFGSYCGMYEVFVNGYVRGPEDPAHLIKRYLERFRPLLGLSKNDCRPVWSMVGPPRSSWASDTRLSTALSGVHWEQGSYRRRTWWWS